MRRKLFAPTASFPILLGRINGLLNLYFKGSKHTRSGTPLAKVTQTRTTVNHVARWFCYCRMPKGLASHQLQITSDNTNRHTLYRLVHNIRSSFGRQGGITMSSPQSLPYLEAVINETIPMLRQRRYSSISIFFDNPRNRTCAK